MSNIVRTPFGSLFFLLFPFLFCKCIDKLSHKDSYMTFRFQFGVYLC